MQDLINEMDKSILWYEERTGKKPNEIRFSIENYKKVARELMPGIKEEKILLTPFKYKGIKITFGVEVK